MISYNINKNNFKLKWCKLKRNKVEKLLVQNEGSILLVNIFLNVILYLKIINRLI